MKKLRLAFMSLALLACLTGCSRSDKTSPSQITGLISYDAPVDFQAGAVLELRLTDVSSDGPAQQVASITVPNLGALPYRYSLPYDAGRINPQHRYTVDARILTNGTLQYSTDTPHEVLSPDHGTQRDITVIAVGANEPMSAQNQVSSPNVVIFPNELRIGAAVTLYKAGLQDGHVIWLEEDRSAGTSVALHARYEFKGALIMHYVDNSPMEIQFDERGRATDITRNHQRLQLNTQADAINNVRNRADLLRSHALAASEAREHRQTTGG